MGILVDFCSTRKPQASPSSHLHRLGRGKRKESRRCSRGPSQSHLGGL